MTHVVTERCVDCRYVDCARVCPVDCFYKVKHPAMLVISPDECIDCKACVPLAFSTCFYRELLDGSPLGNCVLDARQRVLALASIDWADYVLYGNFDATVGRLDHGCSPAVTRSQVPGWVAGLFT